MVRHTNMNMVLLNVCKPTMQIAKVDLMDMGNRDD